jgi:hypothetical protein
VFPAGSGLLFTHPPIRLGGFFIACDLTRLSKSNKPPCTALIETRYQNLHLSFISALTLFFIFR